MLHERDREEFLRMVREVPQSPPQHLLRVAGSVSLDAAKLWAEIWGEFKPHVTPSGAVLSSMSDGFVPSCGWSELLEKFWLLKHHLDSMKRICDGTH